jgi:hypothetical protein
MISAQSAAHGLGVHLHNSLSESIGFVGERRRWCMTNATDWNPYAVPSGRRMCTKDTDVNRWQVSSL